MCEYSIFSEWTPAVFRTQTGIWAWIPISNNEILTSMCGALMLFVFAFAIVSVLCTKDYYISLPFQSNFESKRIDITSCHRTIPIELPIYWYSTLAFQIQYPKFWIQEKKTKQKEKKKTDLVSANMLICLLE